MKKILSIFACLFLIQFGSVAQEIAITNGTQDLCGGFIVDTGLSASDYGNNENITMTICPEDPDTVLNLYFNFFGVGGGDTLWIYDGPDVNAPLIGAFANADLQNQDVTSDPENNDTGCLTLHWESDGSDVGSFGAEISCGVPCIRPLAYVELEEEVPLLVCVDEVITLDGSPSEFAPNTELESWEWVFNDGETNTTDWPVVTHSFDSPGDYKIQLNLVDDNECTNNNLIDVLVLVSTEPTFENTTGDLDLCLGQEAVLHGEVQSTTWTGIPDINFGGALFIPDDQTQCFESEITFGNFDPGQVVEDINDIEHFFINFEHSFMGDLTITFLCPNGQALAVHQQGGGGTWLGEPVDDESDTPGVGYDYYWAPDATDGTWEEESINFGTLPAGTYQSVAPWENLIGCPLNGTWTVEICDLWGADNGFIFDWSMEFAPELYPELIQFTPSYGPDCDSTYWDGPFITDDGGLCNDVTITPTEAGTFDYSYIVTNNHGCSFQEDITVTVTEIIADAGEDVTFCGDDIFLDGSAQTAAPFNNLVWSWDPDGGLSSGTIPNPQVIDVDETTEFTLTVAPNGFPECASSDDVMVIVEVVAPLTAPPGDFESPCPGDELTIGVDIEGGHPDYIISWNNGEYTGEEITISPDSDVSFTVSITDQCGDVIETDVDVTVIDPGTVIDVDDSDLCIGGIGFLNPTGGTGNYSYEYAADSIDVLLSGEVYADYAGTYIVIITDDCHAEGIAEVVAVPCEIIIPNVFTPNNDGNNDAFVIDGILAYPGSILKIYNRWGTLIYESGSYSNNWSPNLEEASEGTYYYTLELNIRSGDNELYSGHLSLLNR
jgi:gliding motility-associated-like protein